MLEKIKGLFKTKNKRNLENLYELVYDVLVTQRDQIVSLKENLKYANDEIFRLAKYEKKYKSLKEKR